jgi:hypothetical protein
MRTGIGMSFRNLGFRDPRPFRIGSFGSRRKPYDDDATCRHHSSGTRHTLPKRTVPHLNYTITSNNTFHDKVPFNTMVSIVSPNKHLNVLVKKIFLEYFV